LKRLLASFVALFTLPLSAKDVSAYGFQEKMPVLPTQLISRKPFDAGLPYAAQRAIIPNGRKGIRELLRLDLVGFSEVEVCRLLDLAGLIPEATGQKSFEGNWGSQGVKFHVLTFRDGRIVKHDIDYRPLPPWIDFFQR
jgi:hypothetical protein